MKTLRPCWAPVTEGVDERIQLIVSRRFNPMELKAEIANKWDMHLYKVIGNNVLD